MVGTYVHIGTIPAIYRLARQKRRYRILSYRLGCTRVGVVLRSRDDNPFATTIDISGERTTALNVRCRYRGRPAL